MLLAAQGGVITSDSHRPKGVKIRIQDPLLDEAEIHYQCTTLQENQTKYPTSISVEEYLLLLSLLLVGNLSICVQWGVCPSKIPHSDLAILRGISTCATCHSNWLTFGEGYIAVLTSISQYLVLFSALLLAAGANGSLHWVLEVMLSIDGLGVPAPMWHLGAAWMALQTTYCVYLPSVWHILRILSCMDGWLYL